MDLLYVVIFCMVTVNTVVGQTEVEGSPYHYNEQLLARVISLELRLQQMDGSPYHYIEQILTRLISLEMRLQELEASTPEVCSTFVDDVMAEDETQFSTCHYIEQLLSNNVLIDTRLVELENALIVTQQEPEKTACDDEWIPFQSSCYWFGNSAMNFESAKALCELSDAHLVDILNATESDFITRLISQRTANGYWIGLTDTEIEGTWVWSGADEDFDFANWDLYTDTEPNGGTRENCVMAQKSRNGRWVDVSCTSSYIPICKK